MTNGTCVVEDTFQIVNELGLHARAATKFVQTANRYRCEVEVEKDGQAVNGKSIMGVLMLVASKGTSIRVRGIGEDAASCVTALGELVRNRFGEER
ncbi:MAG: HPr family phosphocarrier protein [Deltaproteobacteria bacterium]|nr:HPr family phosphocarrier protein [Deltaproteobacteria bacterium]